MIEINSYSIKSYITLNRSCKQSAHGFNIPAGGSLKCDFSNVQCKSYTLYIKKLPGSDNNITINDKSYVLYPNKVSEIKVESNYLYIIRLRGSIGNIVIQKIIIDQLDVDIPIIINNDWHVFLKQVSELKGISVNENGVFATHGAKIIGASIISKVETEPPESAKFVGDDIIFSNPCRLISIFKKDDAQLEKKEIDPIIEKLSLTSNITVSSAAVEEKQQVKVNVNSNFKPIISTNKSYFKTSDNIINNINLITKNKKNRFEKSVKIKFNIYKDEFSQTIPKYCPMTKIVDNDQDILVTDLNNLHESRVVFISYFENISDDKLQILKKSAKVMVSSLKNLKFLKSNGINCIYNPIYFLLDYNLQIIKDNDIIYNDESITIDKILRSKLLVSTKISNHLDPYEDFALSNGCNVYTSNKIFNNRFVKINDNFIDDTKIRSMLNNNTPYLEDNYNNKFYNFIITSL